jgi:YD repeat-containing protein
MRSAKKTYTGPEGIAYGYLYDADNQLTGVQIPDVGFISISAYHWNRPTSMTLPDGATKSFDYDALMRVKNITTDDPAQNPILNYAYSYDRMDNIVAKLTEHGDYRYDYDDLYRLTEADNPDLDDEAFSYDAVGNRLTVSTTTSDWRYNDNNELSGYDDVTFAYDLNGNMIAKNVGGVVIKFFYNLEDRLERVECRVRACGSAGLGGSDGSGDV